VNRVPIAVAAGAAAVIVLGAGARSARAQDRSGILSPTHRNYESPQNFMLELRFGPYRPDVDSDPTLHGTPYNDVFGSPEHFMMAAEFDWQAYRIPHVGTIGPGISFGRVSIGRQAQLATPTASGITTASEDTNLEIFPMTLVGVFRFDMPMREARIPLVPYVKAGLGYALWRGYNDTGTTVVNGVSAKGHTLGTDIAVGLAFNLNVLDEYTARNFDERMGVNHTYLYAEYYSLDLTGIGQSSALRVGNSSWCAGLAFEF
jgi:hypothetical protein